MEFGAEKDSVAALKMPCLPYAGFIVKGIGIIVYGTKGNLGLNQNKSMALSRLLALSLVVFSGANILYCGLC